ncbi:hypothetical protein DNHGIG_20630 [Collibacillus ludicampi]|uniref:Gamma-glutamylcyclotransferase AIG2-like domain-containing protein n=1 Tax=Collibacillus ludicampi TaxID=2771369 RepID=A0AAV4LFA7_9BACL|nr:hypothetical protein DNHGIG_20630 [Collibacillus ludicampi]
MINVFVYGTLLTGERNHRVAEPYICSVQPGRVRGRLYDVGVFSALVLDETDRGIEGEWFDLEEEGLSVLDRLEGYHGPYSIDHSGFKPGAKLKELVH